MSGARKTAKTLAEVWLIAADIDEQRLLYEPGISLEDRILLPGQIDLMRKLARELLAAMEAS